MEVFLETGRLTLRHFTDDNVDDLFELDKDPEVMRFLTGGKPTPRVVIWNEILPRFLRDYERFDGLGTWAVVEKSTGIFWDGSGSSLRKMTVERWSSATGCAVPRREKATPLRVRAP